MVASRYQPGEESGVQEKYIFVLLNSQIVSPIIVVYMSANLLFLKMGLVSCTWVATRVTHLLLYGRPNPKNLYAQQVSTVS